MRYFTRAVGVLSAACAGLAVACLLAACVVVCQLVFVRYVLEASTIWQTEFVLYSVVAATLLGSPQILKTGGHAAVDLLPQALSGPLATIQRIIAAALGFVFVGIIAWSGTRYFIEAWEAGWVTESVWAPPLWIVLLPLPVGFGALALQYAALLFGAPATTPGAVASSSE